MPNRVVEAFDRIRWPQAVLLIAFMASVVAALVWTPAHLIERVYATDWRAVAGVLVALLTAIGGIVSGPLFRSADARATRRLSRRIEQARRDLDDEEEVDDDRRSDPTRPNSPNALERMDRPPGDSPPLPRHRRNGSSEGSTGERAMLFVVAAAVLIACACLAAGCGASAVRTHATLSTVAAATLEQGRRVLLEETDRAIAACPAPSSPERAECLRAGEERLRPAGAGFDAVRLVVLGHREAVETASIAGDGDAVRVALGRVWALVPREWEALLELLMALGADVSSLMPMPAPEVM